MRDRYGIHEDDTPTILAQRSQAATLWMRQLAVSFLEREEWEILVSLRNKKLNLTDIVNVVHSYNRDKTRQILDTMAAEGLVSIFDTLYTLSDAAKLKYFVDTFDDIGKAEGVMEIARKAFEYHVSKGHFVALARQDPKEGIERVDMCGYDYDNGIPISIEIESTSECESHPEKVRKNFEKWEKLGFARMESWSLSPKILEIYDTLDDILKEKIQCFSSDEIYKLAI